MSKEEDIICAIIYMFDENPMYKARLIKLFYLLEWKTALHEKKRLTELEWKVYNMPCCDELSGIINKSTYLRVFDSEEDYGTMVKMKHDFNKSKSFAWNDISIKNGIDHIYNICVNKTPAEIIKLILSTWAVYCDSWNRNHGAIIDFIEKADYYRNTPVRHLRCN